MTQLLSSCSRKTMYLVASLAILTSPARITSQTTNMEALKGLWGAEVRFGMPVQGELTLDGREGRWQASIAGYRVPVKANGNDIEFTLPGSIAAFRGHRNTVSNGINGQWIQQGGVILDPQYASPIELQPIAPSVWRGQVIPLDQRLSVYVFMSSSNGKMTAIVSNPEANLFNRRIYTVTRDGTKVSMEANGQRFEGTYDEKYGVLSVQIANWLPQFQFTRKTKTDAIGFYPRTPSEGDEWAYRKPTSDHDGWTTATMQAEGMDNAPIANLIQQILSADPTIAPLKIQSLLIARHGHLVLEEYFFGFDQDRVHDMRSAGKTFAPVLAGLAEQRGAKLKPETPIYPLFSQYSAFANRDERKEKMTLRDIMTMTAGNACDDNNNDSPGNEDRMQSDATQPDWYKYSLDLPMLKQPGGKDAVYCSGDLNLVGGAVAAVTHSWLPEFFEQNLARPLQFARYYLNLMPDGQAYMGGGAYLRPRDQLKLGQLFLAGGVWNGRRVLNKQWVYESTSFHSRFDAARSLGQEHEYGFGWHIHNLKSGGRIFRVFAAEGNGGQFVIVVPDLDLVVGITGGAYGEFDQWYRWELELVPKFIIPAAEKGAAR